MPDIFLYQGQASPNDIKLCDPTALCPAASGPFGPEDWPSATPPIRIAVDLRTWLQSPAQPVPVAGSPFAQNDWQAASRMLRPIKADYPVDLLTLFAPNPAQPFNQTDWPAKRFREALKSEIGRAHV